jgi:hypothetical protein
MAYGVQHSDVVDLVAFFPDSNEVVLVIIEERQWDESRERLLELQKKIHNYVGFALDGQLVKEYPDFSNKPVRVELRCAQPPSEKIMQFINDIGNRLSNRHDIKLNVIVSMKGSG